MTDTDAAILRALHKVIAAVQAYLPPDGITTHQFECRVIEAVDNPEIVWALRTHHCQLKEGECD